MVLLRWVLFVIAVECLVLLAITPRSVATAILAADFALYFTLYCWTFRGQYTTESENHS